jgi:hypothetical protein
MPKTEDTQAIVAAILTAVRIMKHGIPEVRPLRRLMKPNIERCLIECKSLIAPHPRVVLRKRQRGDG